MIPKKVVVLDIVDNRKRITEFIERGISYVRGSISDKNFNPLLPQYLKAGDICIDLANEVDTYDILSWCHAHDVMYLNTGLNSWHTEYSDPFCQDK